jgi:Ca2+-binding EF-hand superfamily protein
MAKLFPSKARVVNEWDDPKANVLNGKIQWRSGLRRKMSAFDTGVIIGTDKMDQIVRERLNRHTQRNKIGVASANTLKLKIFRMYDTDRSGNIDLEEFTQMLLGLGIRNVHQKDVDDLFDRYVRQSDSGLLDYVRFSKLLVGDDAAHKEEGILYMHSHQQVHRKQREQKGLASRATRKRLLRNIKANGTTVAGAMEMMADQQGRIYKLKMKEIAADRFNVKKGVGDLFDSMDECRFGFLNSKQFYKGMHKRLEEPAQTPVNKFGTHHLHASSTKGVHLLDQTVRGKLEKAMRLWYPVHSITNPHILKSCFERFDTDGSGAIDRKEFTNLLLAIDVRGASQEDVNNLFNKYDEDGSGTIEYNEFCKKFVATFEQSRRGILHFPSSINAHKTRYMETNEREQILRDSFCKRLTENNISPEMICAKAVDRATGMVRRSKLKSLLAYEYQIGIGMEEVLDEMLDRIDHKKDGKLFLLHIAQTFFPGLNKHETKKPIQVDRGALTARIRRNSATALVPKAPQTSRPAHIPKSPMSICSRRSTVKTPRPPQTARHDILRTIARASNQWVTAEPTTATASASKPVSRSESRKGSAKPASKPGFVYASDPNVAKLRMHKKQQQLKKRENKGDQAKRLRSVKFAAKPRIVDGSWVTGMS